MSVFSPNTGKYRPENVHIWTFFTQRPGQLGNPRDHGNHGKAVNKGITNSANKNKERQIQK